MTITVIMQMLLGLGLLFLGRKLYWAFVGAIGFIAVTEWVLTAFQGMPEWIILVIGIAVGLLGALLAIFIRMAGIGFAGFAGGAYIFLSVSRLIGISNTPLQIIFVVMGGILASALLLTLFDWSLMIISALSGALLLSKFIPQDLLPAWIVILLLAAAGFLFQFGALTNPEGRD